MTLRESNPELGILQDQVAAGTYRDWAEAAPLGAGLPALPDPGAGRVPALHLISSFRGARIRRPEARRSSATGTPVLRA
jgi:hypothetical protein